MDVATLCTMIYESDDDDQVCTMEYPDICVYGDSFYADAVFNALTNATSMHQPWTHSFLQLIGTETAWVRNVIHHTKDIDSSRILPCVFKHRKMSVVHVATPNTVEKKKEYEMMIIDDLDAYVVWKQCHMYMDKKEYIIVTYTRSDLIENIERHHPQIDMQFVYLPEMCGYTVITIGEYKDDPRCTRLRSFCKRTDVIDYLDTWKRVPRDVATREDIQRLLAERFASKMTLSEVLNLHTKVMASLPVVYTPLRYTNQRLSLDLSHLYDIRDIDSILEVL